MSQTASGSALQEFEKIAIACKVMDATALIQQQDGKIIELTAFVDSLQRTARYFVRGEKGYVIERFQSKSMIEVFKEAGKKFGNETLLVPQIRVVSDNTALSKSELRMLAVAAFCEAFGVPIPTERELQELDKEAKNASEKERNNLIAYLRGGKDGIDSWNKVSPKSRTRCHPLKKLDLKGQDLRAVQLIGPQDELLDMQGSCFNDAKLSEAKFDHCDLRKSSFKNADCSAMQIHQSSKFADCDFRGANLSNAVLAYTTLTRTIFNDADLKGADLCKCNFKGASFVNADLRGAKLNRADLRGTDLSSIKTSDHSEFLEALYDENTRFPEHFGASRGLKWKGTGKDPLQAERAKVACTVAGDFDSFMEQLVVDFDKSRLDKALKMLKAESFKLFAEVSDSGLVGVVKSQTDAELLYACRLTNDGEFSCCTQNLFACGGLRGALCKHLLVLLIGLTKANGINPKSAYEWAMSSGARKPKLLENEMSETFLRYRAAEAGEIDWRPTETIPEDYYAF